tara:strand:+ start:2365 stop:2634 length:270 start_codon:yes stop_codon:yes gene_type:complete
MKIFKQDTIVFFDRTTVNLKGIQYEIDDSLANRSWLHIDNPKDLAKIKEQIGSVKYEDALERSGYQGGDEEIIILGEEDFQDTFNPFEL